ncbi:MAG: pentapeptide repeat-containing protein [Cyanobacteria bacterium P01_D01_bin.73]
MAAKSSSHSTPKALLTLRTFSRWGVIALSAAVLGVISPVTIASDRAIAEEENIDFVEQLLRERKCRECDLRYRNLEGVDLEGVNLKRANLYGANLQRTNLAGADLREANLGATDLRGANLAKADLRRTSFEGAKMNAVNLESADLRQANFYLTDLTGARLVEANLQGARWREIQAELAEFCGATMPDGTTFQRSCFDPRQDPDQLQY